MERKSWRNNILIPEGIIFQKPVALDTPSFHYKLKRPFLKQLELVFSSCPFKRNFTRRLQRPSGINYLIHTQFGNYLDIKRLLQFSPIFSTLQSIYVHIYRYIKLIEYFKGAWLCAVCLIMSMYSFN